MKTTVCKKLNSEKMDAGIDEVARRGKNDFFSIQTATLSDSKKCPFAPNSDCVTYCRSISAIQEMCLNCRFIDDLDRELLQQASDYKSCPGAR